MKIRNCFAALILVGMSLAVFGCDTNNPKGKLLAPTGTGRIESNKADGDGIIVRGGKLVPMVGPLLPGQVRPMVRVGDPDADEVLKGDPDGTGNEARRIGDPTSED